MSVAVELDIRNADAALGRILARLANPRPALEAIGQEFASKALLGFHSSRDPWGKAWAPLGELVRKQRGESAKPLRKTNQLMASHTYRVSGDAVEIGGNVDYASHHQFGTRRGIPARPFLPLTSESRVDLPREWAEDAVGIVEAMIEAADSGN